MRTSGKRIATAIGMIVVLSLAFVGQTSAMGKGNKQTGNMSRFQQGQNLKRRNGSQSGTCIRSVASSTRHPKGLFANGEDDPVAFKGR